MARDNCNILLFLKSGCDISGKWNSIENKEVTGVRQKPLKSTTKHSCIIKGNGDLVLVHGNRMVLVHGELTKEIF